MSETPQIYACKRPRALKRHKCCECGGTILPGEIYENFAGRWDRWQTFKTCPDCLRVRKGYWSAVKHAEDRPPFGELHAHVRDADDFAEIATLTCIRRKRGSLKPADGQLKLYTDAARYSWWQGSKRYWGKDYKCVVTDAAGKVLNMRIAKFLMRRTDVAEAYAHMLAVFHAGEAGAASVIIHTDNLGATVRPCDKTHPRWAVVTLRDRLIWLYGLTVSYVFVTGEDNPADAPSRKPGMR
jgi:hypothetical protein